MHLEHLIAFNDEVAALSRAGVPLGYGLAQLGGDLPNQLGKITSAVGERIEAGESLDAIFANETGDFPEIYAAVVAAGIKSGNLTAATDGLAQTLRRVANVRRSVGFAMIYPVTVFVLASVLFVFCLRRVFPVLESAIQSFAIPESPLLDQAISIFARTNMFLLVIPFLLVLFAILWWRRTGNAISLRHSSTGWMYSLLPWASRLMRCGQIATFSDLLALLVEQRVPLGEALTLSAKATGAKDIIQDAEQLCARIERGDASAWESESADSEKGLPPLLLWTLAGQQSNSRLTSQLSRLAQTYHRRAEELAHWLRTVFPAIATAVVAGSVTVIYCGSFLAPWFSFLLRIVNNVGQI